MSKILFATSEMYPLIKTGGLGDVSYSLPIALSRMSQDVRVLIPGYPSVLENAEHLEVIGPITGFMIPEGTQLIEARLLDVDLTLWIVDCPLYFTREGGPYIDSHQQEWPDNAHRFAMFSRVIAEVARGVADLNWVPDVVHCNDWQTGLAPALISLQDQRPATIFTIHNLAYQGNFSKQTFDELMLPIEWWSIDGVEFYHKLSFLKAGIQFADKVTTVSPTYAKEIMDHEYGYGMDGLLGHHSNKLTGVLNGVDYSTWSPKNDSYITFNYDADSLDEKVKNKLDLQRKLGLKLTKGTPVLGMVCRLVHQKGVDYVIEAIKATLGTKVQWVILGSGEDYFEHALQQLAQDHPDKISITIGYSETLAHKIEAGADAFVMASRYEPCGLNQIYSLRYGTLPIVRNTGGLADTVCGVKSDSSNLEEATGFVFEDTNTESLVAALESVCSLFRKKKKWRVVQNNAMEQDFSWGSSALIYIELYEEAQNVVREGQAMAE